MKVLRIAKAHLKFLGCVPADGPKSSDQFTRKISITNNTQYLRIGAINVVLILNIASTICIYLTEKDIFDDLSESIFWISRSILSLALYSMFIWYMPDVITSFEDLDEIVDQSE